MHQGEIVGTPQPMFKPSGRPAVSVVTILILLQVRCTNIMTKQYFSEGILLLAGWPASCSIPMYAITPNPA